MTRKKTITVTLRNGPCDGESFEVGRKELETDPDWDRGYRQAVKDDLGIIVGWAWYWIFQVAPGQWVGLFDLYESVKRRRAV